MKAIIVSVKPRFLPDKPESGFVHIKKAEKDIYVRVFDDVIVYVYQCIDEIHGNLTKKHNLTSFVIQVIKEDMIERNLSISEEEFYLILHDKDLVPGNVNRNAIYPESERSQVKSKWDCIIPDGHIFLFQHERNKVPFKSFIAFLGCLNNEMVVESLKLFK